MVLRILASRWACAVGTFSYSIYLIHYPMIVLFWHLTMRIEMSAVMRAGVMYGVGFPLMMAVAYVFHLSFERHFMPGHLQPASRRTLFAWRLKLPIRKRYDATLT